jgi:D-3-phosphoglycerate dehydrogenase
VARVLVTEKLAQTGLELLAEAGHDVDVRLGLSPEELTAAVEGAQALIIRSATTVTAEVLAAGSDLVVVGRAGIGLDNVDVAAATERGVMVVNAPQSNILSAAEQAMALLLAQARNIPQAHAALVAGKWERSKWEGVELHGKTLGVVGLGRVGALVAQRGRPGPSHGRRAHGARRAHGHLRLRDHPPPEECRDNRALRQGAAGGGQGRHPDHQHRSRRHHR